MALNLSFLLMSPGTGDGDTGDTSRAGDPPRATERINGVSRAEQELSQEDVICVAAIRTGDRVAFEELYRRRYTELFRAAVRLGHSRAIADEIVQDIFLALWIRRSGWTVRSSVRAYLHGAVRFRAASIHRHNAVRQDAEALEASDFPELADTSADADAALETATIRGALLNEIRALPSRQREALILWSRHQMTLTELGESLGVSHVAARKLLRKAQQRLQAIVDR